MSNNEELEEIVESVLNGLNEAIKKGQKNKEDIKKRLQTRKSMEILSYSSNKAARTSTYVRNNDFEQIMIERIKSKDKFFEEELFEKWVVQVFNDFYNAFNDGDLYSLRGILDDHFLEEQQMIIENNLLNGMKCFYKIDTSNYVDIINYNVENEVEMIELMIGATGYIYTCLNDGREISGSKKAKDFGHYYVSLIRSAVKNDDDAKDNVEMIHKYLDGDQYNNFRCHNCGAIIKRSNCYCTYCGSLVKDDYHCWTVLNIEHI